MALLFTGTLFLGAALLFCVQPMVGKMVLPLLGGSPAVWNTCLVFFQATLLAGYAYAHLICRFRPGVQALVHGTLLLLPIALLPVALPPGTLESLPRDANPAPWLLGVLCRSVGLPFFVLATGAPLLQRWFSRTADAQADDPYFLYGASNLGSMLALLGYPFLIEPHLSLARQRMLWSVGYYALVVLALGCALAAWRGARTTGDAATEAAVAPIAPRRRLRWVALAFVPSSWMVGVTTYVSTDIAALPLLWVLPLALYLLTFILTFSARALIPHVAMVRALPMLVVLLVFTIFLQATQAIWIVLHLLTFLVAAMVCHGELAADRPPPRHLTEFYLWLSVGGLLGGLFNALVAPVVFDRVVEYPLAVVLGCALLPAGTRAPVLHWLPIPLAIGALLLVGQRLPGALGIDPNHALVKLAFGLVVVAVYSVKARPAAFALGIGAILVASGFYGRPGSQVLLRERTFFGVVRVTHERDGNYHEMTHGSTVHGRQSLDPRYRAEPLTYYHPSGPIGEVFSQLHTNGTPVRIGVIGLGTGSLAAYAAAAQEWTFYEIDPAVARLAHDRRYFTFLPDCAARQCTVVLGDGRLRLRDAPTRAYRLLILDAFSSDAIPVHLLTREAFALYLDRLADGGIVAVHVSNRHLDLKPVLGELARDAGLVARGRDDGDTGIEAGTRGKTASQWVVLARDDADLGALAHDRRWNPLPDSTSASVWTDDFSNVFGILRWH